MNFRFKLFLLILVLELINPTIIQANALVAEDLISSQEEESGQEIFSQVQSYYAQGQYSKAISLLNQLLQKPQQIEPVTIHSNLAEIYRHLGQYSRAIAHWKAAIESIPTQKDRLEKPQLIVLSKLKVDLARAYIHLGQASLAIPLLQESIGLAKQTQKPEIENAAQRALGNAYKIAGEYERAIIAYTNSLEKTQNPETTTRIFNGLVDVYQLRSQQYLTEARGADLEGNSDLSTQYTQLANTDRAKAKEYAKRAVKVSKNLTSLATVRALLNLSHLSSKQETTANFEQILSILNHLPASRSKVYLLINLAELEQQKAIEVLSKAAETATTLKDKRALSFALGALGNAYEKKGSLKQALVWTQKAQLAAQQVFAVDSLYQWQWQAGRLYQRIGAEDTVRDAYREAIASVQSIRNDLLNAEKQLQLDFSSQVEPIYREFLSLLLESGNEANIQEALATADLLQLSQLQSLFGDDCLEIKSNLQADKALTLKDTVIIRSIILEDKTYLILRLPDGTVKSYPARIEAKQLQMQIDNWRYSLEDLSSERYLSLSQSLYDLLISPLAKDLATYSKIVFINDGRLRNVPMAALHDGQKFLIEKYAISYSLGLNSVSKHEIDRDNLKTLAFGLTVGTNGFPPLANVRQEIDNIAKFVGGRQFLNREFTQENFQRQLKKGYPIVHLATHARFEGSTNSGFIQAFDGEISLTKLETILSGLQQPIELLVLLRSCTKKN